MNAIAMVRRASDDCAAIVARVPQNPRLPLAPEMSEQISAVYRRYIRDWPLVAPGIASSLEPSEGCANKPVEIKPA